MQREVGLGLGATLYSVLWLCATLPCAMMSYLVHHLRYYVRLWTSFCVLKLCTTTQVSASTAKVRPGQKIAN